MWVEQYIRHRLGKLANWRTGQKKLSGIQHRRFRKEEKVFRGYVQKVSGL